MIRNYIGRIKLEKGNVVEKEIKVYNNPEKLSDKGCNKLLHDLFLDL
jgi:hypothetical protein